MNLNLRRHWSRFGEITLGVFVLEFGRRQAPVEVLKNDEPRVFRVIARPPELALLITAIFLGGLLADGALHYVLLCLAWQLSAIVLSSFLPALLALMVAGSAVVGIFGPNPESFLAFAALNLLLTGALIGALITFLGCVEMLRRFRDLFRPRAGRRRRSLKLPSRREASRAAPSRLLRRPSLSQYIVGLAVRRLPAEIGEEGRARWEEEMRRDVEEGLPLLRVFYALGIWLRGAPAMVGHLEEAPKRNTRG